MTAAQASEIIHILMDISNALWVLVAIGLGSVVRQIIKDAPK